MSEPNDARADLPRVVVDTNQLLLGMFQRGLLLPIFQAWIRNEFVMITSSELLDELGDVIARPKFQKRITKSDAEKLIELIYRKAEIVVTSAVSVVSRDPDDYPVLSTAIVGKASHIITGDKDMLEDAKLKFEMKRFGVDVVTAGEFLQALNNRRKPN
ncbi:MAG: putative toxin-antitoxin system toxin component, PIN family [Chloroflexi bacterium]|nr:putative toxin-antitoxin system toxin component, PIN family [Chloroflexota bacterium]